MENKEKKANLAYFKPYTDIVEAGDDIKVYVDMPGVDKDQIKISLEQGKLVVEGGIETALYDSLRPQHREYAPGHFRRSFHLTERVDREQIEAHYENGVLELKLPKVEEAKPKEITVH